MQNGIALYESDLGLPALPFEYSQTPKRGRDVIPFIRRMFFYGAVGKECVRDKTYDASTNAIIDDVLFEQVLPEID